MISLDNNTGSKEFASIEPLLSSSLTTIFDFSDADIPGDAFFTGNGPAGKLQIGLEFKSLHDLCGSLDSGRAQGQGTGTSHGQLLRMLDYYDVTILVYYGNYWPGDDLTIRYLRQSGKGLLSRIAERARKVNNINRLCRWVLALPTTLRLGTRRHYWHGLHNALTEIQLIHNEDGKSVDIHRVNNRNEVATLTLSLYHFFNKQWSQHTLLRAFNTSNPASSRLSRLATLDRTPPHIITCAKLISAIDVIGYERGIAIAYHFNGNIPMMISSIASNPSAIADIRTGTNTQRRIGPVVSEAVHRAIGSGAINVDDITRLAKV